MQTMKTMTKTQMAAQWLGQYLGTDTVPSVQVVRDGMDAGFTRSTLYKAADTLKVESVPLTGRTTGWKRGIPAPVRKVQFESAADLVKRKGWSVL